MECDVCKSQLRVGDRLYSCSIIEEFLEHGCYSVLSDHGFIAVCSQCIFRFDPIREIESRLFELIQLKPKSTDESKVSAIHNFYDCQKCLKSIRDGDTMVTLNHSFETLRENSLHPDESWIAYILCKPCGLSTNFEKCLEKVIGQVLPVAKKAIIHTIG